MAIPLTLSSVPNVLPYIQYVATNGQTVYPYPFPITQDSDLVLIINGVTQATDSTYSLSGQGNATGGNVTLNTGSQANDIITMYRDVAIQRITQIAQNSGFSSSAFNGEFNNIYLILQQLEEAISLCLQIPITNNPAPVATLLPGTYANKYLAFDTYGNPTPALLTSSGSITAAMIAGLIFAQTAFEASNGITPTNLLYQPGDLRRYGGVPDSGATDNTVPLKHALTACAGNVPVIVAAVNGGYFGNINGMVPVPAGSDLQLKDGAKLEWASTTASSGPSIGGTATRPGLSITGANVKISGQGSIVGPTAAGVFVANEVGIIAVGTSAAAKFLNIVIDGVEVTGWGEYAILPKWIQQLRVTNCYIHDNGYAGIVPLSCTDGVLTGNEICRSTPGSSSNAYGINLSYDTSTTNSRTDPNHMCIGFEVAYNFVHDIPIWLGITTHGSFDSTCHHNKVYNCWTGIQFAADGSGSYCGENNSICDNVVTLAQYNGSATTVAVANPIGITLNGNTTLHSGVRCVGNVVTGYGSTAPGYSIQASFMDNPVIADNLFRNWSGFGIYSAASNGGTIADNVFEAVQSTYTDDAPIHIATHNNPWLITGNKHHIPSGTAAHLGAVVPSGSGSTPTLFGPNDFGSATVAPYGNTSGGALAGQPYVQGYGPNANLLVDMTPDTGTFTGVVTGCTAGVNSSCVWSRNGNQVTLFLGAGTGTSNTTAMTMTGLPTEIQPARTQDILVQVEDSSANAAGAAQVAASSGTITFGKGFIGGVFTNSGTKGMANGTITYLLN